MDRRNYWITPDGDLIDIGSGIATHNDWAREYLIKEYGREYYERLEYNEYPYQVLHKMGWVRVELDFEKEQKVCILGDCISLTKPMRNTMSPAMNQIQLSVAKNLCYLHDFDFHKAINDKIFW